MNVFVFVHARYLHAFMFFCLRGDQLNFETPRVKTFWLLQTSAKGRVRAAGLVHPSYKKKKKHTLFWYPALQIVLILVFQFLNSTASEISASAPIKSK